MSSFLWKSLNSFGEEDDEVSPTDENAVDTEYDSRMRYRHHGCDVEAIVATMFSEQSEQLYNVQFCKAYKQYRKVVLEWVINLTARFNLHPTTAHAAISYLDRLQLSNKYTRFQWQILAVCCILLSAKYNECEEQVPGLKKLEEIMQVRLPNHVILEYELLILQRLAFKLNGKEI